jgi:hypothetical protein
MWGSTIMARQVSDCCASCGVAFVIGPVFVDYISALRGRGLRRALDFDYQLYSRMFGHEGAEGWPTYVTLEDCDSVFLGDVIDPEMRCPKCGGLAFVEEGT